MKPPGGVIDNQTPSQSSRAPARLEIRSLREVISSCDKLSLGEQGLLSASIDSLNGLESSRTANSSWVGSFHDKMQSKTPGKSFNAGTPTHRQLNFNTPAGKQPERPSPTVSSVYSDRWCLDAMTPGMRYTPPNMAMRGMRINGPREAIAAYRMDISARRENERGNSLCILPTPLLRYQPSPEVSPTFVPSKPSPTVSSSVILGSSPTPGKPMQKKPRGGRDFPLPREWRN